MGHATADRLAQLLAERAEHQVILATRPPERLRHVFGAPRKLEYARKDRDEAAWRLDNARHELGQLGLFSQLRGRGRRDKAMLLERIGRFEGDVQNAEGKVIRCEHNMEEVQRQFGEEIEWGARHGWRAERLDAIEAELAEIRGESEAPECGRSAGSRPATLLTRRDTVPHTPSWEQRLAEIAAPRLPDTGHGIDIGL